MGFVPLESEADVFSRQRAAREEVISCLLEEWWSAAVPALEKEIGEFKYNSPALGMHDGRTAGEGVRQIVLFSPLT